ncbi:NeuA CMP-N-acetylneuraminic acid synthetase [Candidatus Pelagibacterales bacterium]
MKKILCTICMRKGSKGVKNKNLLKINNQYLMKYTIRQAINSKVFDKIVISSNSEKILNISKRFKPDLLIKRSEKLSNDTAGKISVIQDAVTKSEKNFNYKFDYVCDLDVTAPLRRINDIKKAYKQFLKKNLDMITSACIGRRNPFFNMVKLKNYRIFYASSLKNRNFLRRQDAPRVFDLNASIYFWKRDQLMKLKNKTFCKKSSLYIMPFERSIDIDTPSDLKIVKLLMQKKKREYNYESR